jgi:hypothetical protein
MIQCKYVRYYTNEKRYIYFGITKLGWERFDAHNAKAIATNKPLMCKMNPNNYCQMCEHNCYGQAGDELKAYEVVNA